ncbi:glycoside hydrolase family 78 protein [Flavobacterium daejeonense]|uniref:glycoside hydrolase family 78 protein n=1 Tax=Flavobacterium daejeonense TaxID=350893 RepID=UPI00047D6A9C|nr:SusE domain-containing protein [Flavobacterium daejeonense]
MRKIVALFLIISFLISCGGGDSSSESETVNTAPTAPSLVTPANNTLCINNAVSLEWNPATDAENNPITYQIQIATDNQFAQIVKTAEGTASYQSFTLNKGMAYYWRVKATDSKNAPSTYSNTFSFYTEGDAVANHAPFLPQIVQPEINSLISATSVTLKWLASDVDASDVLTYDIYCGMATVPMTKVGSNLTVTSLQINDLQFATNYYWKVVVKDNKGGETIGQIWNFKTN